MKENTKNRKTFKMLLRAEIKKLVAMFSRGNVNLQKGAYLTKEDIDLKRQQILKYDFSDL